MDKERDRLFGAWYRTTLMRLRNEKDPSYKEGDRNHEAGYYAGRPIIARDTPINGGVYVGSFRREAIVVDDEKYPEELDEAYSKALRSPHISGVRTQFRTINATDFAKAAYDSTRETLGGKNDPELLRELVKAHVDPIIAKADEQGYTGNVKIALNYFIDLGAGVARHNALLSGYLMERFIKEGLIDGHISIDRNIMPKIDHHEWARYTQGVKNPNVTVIDPYFGYLGPVGYISQYWDYRRPEDVAE